MCSWMSAEVNTFQQLQCFQIDVANKRNWGLNPIADNIQKSLVIWPVCPRIAATEFCVHCRQSQCGRAVWSTQTSVQVHCSSTSTQISIQVLVTSATIIRSINKSYENLFNDIILIIFIVTLLQLIKSPKVNHCNVKTQGLTSVCHSCKIFVAAMIILPRLKSLSTAEISSTSTSTSTSTKYYSSTVR